MDFLTNRESSVGIAMSAGWTAGNRFPAGARDLYLLHSVQTGSRVHNGNWASFSPEVKRPWRETDHTPPPSWRTA
jgi:hypothetical protein